MATSWCPQCNFEVVRYSCKDVILFFIFCRCDSNKPFERRVGGEDGE